MLKKRYVWVVEDPTDQGVYCIKVFSTQKMAIEYVKISLGDISHSIRWNTEHAWGDVIDIDNDADTF